MRQDCDDYISDEDHPEQPGRVSEARRAWLVRTDQELAFKLQDDEIVHHLVGNKNRNEQIREDFPTAAAVQAHDEDRVQQEFMKRKHLMEEDARIAHELQKKLLFEKEQRVHHSGKGKNSIGSHSRNDELHKSGEYVLMQPSSSKVLQQERRKLLNEEEYNSSILNPSDISSDDYIHIKPNDVASGTSRAPQKPIDDIQNHSKAGTSYQGQQEEITSSGETTKEIKELEMALGVPRKMLFEEKERLLQEEKDAEMARQLSTCEELNETRDGELARILQAREVERYNKSKERQRLRQRQKHESGDRRSERQSNNVVLTDTYSHPRDVLPALRNVNEYGDGDGDSHYMEVFPSEDLLFNPHPNYKNLRMPPEAPKLAGRPKLAEPNSAIDSLDASLDSNGFQESKTTTMCSIRSRHHKKTEKKSKKQDGSCYPDKKNKCNIQ